MVNQTRAILAAPWRGEDPTPAAPLFVSGQGRRLSKRRAQQVFALWQERAGFDQRHTFHPLRQAAVHQVYRATKDILLTRRFARHSSPLVKSVYLANTGGSPPDRSGGEVSGDLPATGTARCP